MLCRSPPPPIFVLTTRLPANSATIIENNPSQRTGWMDFHCRRALTIRISNNGPLTSRMPGTTPSPYVSLGHNRSHKRADEKLDANASTLFAFPESGIYAAWAINAEASPTIIHNAGWARYCIRRLNDRGVNALTGVSSK